LLAVNVKESVLWNMLVALVVLAIWSELAWIRMVELLASLAPLLIQPTARLAGRKLCLSFRI
jgi:hypothetical protein